MGHERRVKRSGGRDGYSKVEVDEVCECEFRCNYNNDKGQISRREYDEKVTRKLMGSSVWCSVLGGYPSPCESAVKINMLQVLKCGAS